MDSLRRIPPNQQLIRGERWPVVGESAPAKEPSPWLLTITGEVHRGCQWSLPELRTMSSCSQRVDIHCVTRWSKLDMEFSGVRLRDLLGVAEPTSLATHLSFVARSVRRHSSSLTMSDALGLDILVAWSVDGAPLSEIHGGPLRLIVPGRYFYKSVKWLERIEVLPHDRLGYWEADAGYHNHADPWLEERYIAPSITKQDAARLMESRDFSGRDLRSLEAADRDLTGLKATDALLRNANFRRAHLQHADFSRANLSNAHFENADLRGACLSDADVEGASFVGADLRGADLRVASLFGATFVANSNVSGQEVPARIDETTQIDPDRLAALTDEQLEWFQVK